MNDEPEMNARRKIVGPARLANGANAIMSEAGISLEKSARTNRANWTKTNHNHSGPTVRNRPPVPAHVSMLSVFVRDLPVFVRAYAFDVRLPNHPTQRQHLPMI